MKRVLGVSGPLTKHVRQELRRDRLLEAGVRDAPSPHPCHVPRRPTTICSLSSLAANMNLGEELQHGTAQHGLHNSQLWPISRCFVFLFLPDLAEFLLSIKCLRLAGRGSAGRQSPPASTPHPRPGKLKVLSYGLALVCLSSTTRQESGQRARSPDLACTRRLEHARMTNQHPHLVRPLSIRSFIPLPVQPMWALSLFALAQLRRARELCSALCMHGWKLQSSG